MTDSRPQLDISYLDPQTISPRERAQMFHMMDAYYEGVPFVDFYKDLDDGRNTFIFRDADSGELGGFSTVKLLNVTVEDTPIIGLFSGDTIIDRKYWGSRAWPKAIGNLGLTLNKESSDDTRVYWFPNPGGHRTYSVLSRYFHTFYPTFREETPSFEKQVIDALGFDRFPHTLDDEGNVVRRSVYNKETGVVELNYYPLREGVADITEEVLKDPDIKFFDQANPGWKKGDELATIAELCEENMKPKLKDILDIS